MPSVDPNNTFPRTVAGIEFQIKELKAGGMRDIGRTLAGMSEQKTILAQLDCITPCALRYVVGWDQPEEMCVDSLEAKLTIVEIIELLKLTIAGSKLTDDDRKKFE